MQNPDQNPILCVYKRGWLYITVFACILLLIMYLRQDKVVTFLKRRRTQFSLNASSFVFKDINGFQHRPIIKSTSSVLYLYANYTTHDILHFKSPYIVSEQNNSSDGIKDTINSNKKNEKVEGIKTIAVYDPLGQYKNFLKEYTLSGCEYNNCKPIKNFEEADAVIFIMPKLKTAPTFERKPKQIWIFYTIEAPSRSGWFNMLEYPSYKNGINLTVSFTFKSDVTNLYGKLLPVKDPPKKDYDSIFLKKSKMAAWFVSHCQTRSERRKFIGRMTTRLDVDIFGGCGTETCRDPERPNWGKHEREMVDESTCFPMLSSQYKFYLAFENTLCREYITEKFFKMFRDVDIIPVVRGGANYQKYFPKGMYVDASDFSTPESLADFLLDLAADKERYIQYLKNKDRYRYASNPNLFKCRLCEKLNTMDSSSSHVAYENVRDWWTNDSCYDPRDSLTFW